MSDARKRTNSAPFTVVDVLREMGSDPDYLASRVAHYRNEAHILTTERDEAADEIERLTTTLDAIEKALSAPTHLHRYNKDIHSSECFACRLREWVTECLQGAAEGGPS